ncbi:fluoride efflux transporter CrcB [Paenibacillus apiarius]|uniref:fluoride efflux transporter CrcB n=1 Tax=Paenibacillus apiarius TaxID=46240 RepID=UPI003B3B8D96
MENQTYNHRLLPVRVSPGTAVAAGGCIGACLRYGISRLLPFEAGFPWATWSVNMFGCFFLGWLFTYLVVRPRVSALWKPLLGTGLTGALTTFSTFSLETVQLLEAGKLMSAAIYQLSSMLCGLLLAWGGLLLAKRSCGATGGVSR